MKLLCATSDSEQDTLNQLHTQLNQVPGIHMGALNHTTLQNALQKLECRAQDAQGGYRNIFENAFRQLEDHILEVQNVYRSQQTSQLPRWSRSGRTRAAFSSDISLCDTVQGDYSSLCSSLQIFQIRGSRPVTSFSRPSTPSSQLWHPGDRPTTSPGHITSRFLSEPRFGPGFRYDLNQFLRTAALFPEAAPSVCYGCVDAQELENIDNICDSGPCCAMKTDAVWLNPYHLDGTTLVESPKVDSSRGDTSSTSGVGSDTGISENEVEDCKENLDDGNGNCSEIQGAGLPIVDPIGAQSGFYQRPDDLDLTHFLNSDVKDTDFDFDAKLLVPKYEFKCPIPFPLSGIDLSSRVRDDSDWRRGCYMVENVPPSVTALMNRLLHMEKLQMETRDWERKCQSARKRSASRGMKRSQGMRGNQAGGGVESTCTGNCAGKCSSSRAQQSMLGNQPGREPSSQSCDDQQSGRSCCLQHENIRVGDKNSSEIRSHEPRQNLQLLASNFPNPHKTCSASGVLNTRPKSAFNTNFRLRRPLDCRTSRPISSLGMSGSSSRISADMNAGNKQCSTFHPWKTSSSLKKATNSRIRPLPPARSKTPQPPSYSAPNKNFKRLPSHDSLKINMIPTPSTPINSAEIPCKTGNIENRQQLILKRCP